MKCVGGQIKAFSFFFVYMTSDVKKEKSDKH